MTTVFRRSLLLLAALAGLGVPAFAAPLEVVSPDQEFGQLYSDVEWAGIFPDQKTFADCYPIGDPSAIEAEYATSHPTGVQLAAFVNAHFIAPEARAVVVPKTTDLEMHLNDLWPILTRTPDAKARPSSLLPLVHPYVEPGGRFREVYYWDSYFTMLGLRESGRDQLVRDMVDNFASELMTYGLVPNGNRSYYLTRSQPPFFALMVQLVAEKDGDKAYRTYHEALQAEYAYWCDETFPSHHLVHLPDDAVLSRYYDRVETPRPEAFRVDQELCRSSTEPPRILYRNLRAAAESGWDFSSRWLEDGRTLATIRTTELLPVDLNCLLYQLELTLAKSDQLVGDTDGAAALRAAAGRRRAAIIRFCYAPQEGYFFDYDLAAHRRGTAWTLAGVVPLFTGVANPDQAAGVARAIGTKFLRAGGVVTTLVTTGQQWDAPNGWAPLEWMTIQGLRNYGHDPLAAEIARRWIALNRRVFLRTGKMMEKYNVEDVSLAAGGGEYPSQDGFGWTNGVLLKLLHLYPDATAHPGEAAH